MPVRLFAVAAVLLLTSIAHGQAEPDLLNKVRAAYAATNTYRATQTFDMIRMEGRWKLSQTFEVAYNRSGRSLLVDQPQVRVVHDGNTVYVRPEWMPGSHIERPIRGQLTFSKLIREAPFLENPPLPDIALLLGDMPFDHTGVVETPVDDQGFKGLQFNTQAGQIVLKIDPKTHLVRRLVWSLTGAMLEGAEAHEKVTAVLDINVTAHNSELPADTFSHDWGTEKIAMPSSNPGHEDAMSMEGQPAPPVQLKDLDGNVFDLAQADADVVVLDFWATWCGPCVIGLSELADVQKWAKNKDKSVRIVAVNRGEDRELVQQFWTKNDYGFATVLDTMDLVSSAYQVGAIPHTVFISDGKVQVVQIGTGRGAAEHYKQVIDDLLAEQGG